MQTFLPYPDFRRSAESLDSARLGKQRVETLQILRALELPEYGWANHPAVKMWRGYTPALVLYGLICARTWQRRGHADSTEAQILEFAPAMAVTTQEELQHRRMLPPWLGDEALHVSHRSKLLTKDPDHYRSDFAGTPTGLDYLWPEPIAMATPAQDLPGVPLWVVRAESAATLGVLISEGIVALGTESGLDVDVTGRELADLQSMIGSGRRRTSKPLLGLARFLVEMTIGDDVGVFIAHDRALLVGRITGEYEFTATAAQGLVHRRSVSWDEVIERTSVLPPASLQDVRPVFRVSRKVL